MTRDCIAILPARGGSKRLLGKNLYPVFKKPMLQWVAECCLAVDQIRDVWVSSDDDDILALAEMLGCRPLQRPAELADDLVPKMEAVRHAWQQISGTYDNDIVSIAVVQANSPEIRPKHLHAALRLLEKHALWEVFSVDQKMVQNGAFRIVRTDALHNTFLSAHMGVVRTNYVDIHTKEDVDKMLKKYSNIDAFKEKKGV